MSEIKILALGAGQDVGRSCILVYIGNRCIMLDCGMHMCYSDARKFPDFSFITKSDTLTNSIDCVLISHFHLDHVGALPYMTEKVGYNGPIYMTSPTKAISRILIEDMRKIVTEKKLDPDLFTIEMIGNCFDKVSEIGLHETKIINNDIEIKAYYAGHVLGAAMFYIKVGHQSLVYTGDFNMTSDTHLGAAWIDRCMPDILITESTYSTTIRESRRCRENDMLTKVHQIIDNGGKVLIPVFALGRAQEICLLLERYWEQKDLKVPIYMTTGMAEKAIHFYKLFISWTNEHFKNAFYKRNFFQFKHTQSFDRSLVDSVGPMVVLASPGMLHAGMSCFIFKKWASNPNNAVVLPGYCAIGTLGHKILQGHKIIENDDKSGNNIEVKLQILNMSFSAHADANGILKLIDYCRPKKAVILVHGESDGMKLLANGIKTQFNLECYFPNNGEILSISTDPVPIKALIKSNCISRYKIVTNQRFHGCLSLIDDSKYPIRISNINELNDHKSLILSINYNCSFKRPKKNDKILMEPSYIIGLIKSNVLINHPNTVINDKNEKCFSIESVIVKISPNPSNIIKSFSSISYDINIEWNRLDKDIALSIIQLIEYTFNKI